MLISVSHGVDALAAVKRGSDLLVRLNEALELYIQVPVLVLKHGAVIVKCVDLAPDVVIALAKALVCESQVVYFVPRHGERFVRGPDLGFVVIDRGGHVALSVHLVVVTLSVVFFFRKFHVKLPREALLLVLKPGLLVAALK